MGEGTDRTRWPTGGAVQGTPWDAVRDAVRDVVRDAVRDVVRDAVRDVVEDAVRDAVRDAVLDAVWDTVWDAVRDTVQGVGEWGLRAGAGACGMQCRGWGVRRCAVCGG